jgi:hypothetical protein
MTNFQRKYGNVATMVSAWISKSNRLQRRSARWGHHEAQSSRIGPIKDALEPTKGSAEEIPNKEMEKDRECI